MADEPPGYTINVESGNVVVQHTGKLTVRVIEGSRREVAELAAARQLTGILLDLSRATSSLSTAEIFELCVSQRSVLPLHAAVAVVVRPGQFPAEDAHFAEAVSLNRGTGLRTFTDCGAAQRWLSARRGPRPG